MLDFSNDPNTLAIDKLKDEMIGVAIICWIKFKIYSILMSDSSE